MHKQRNKVIFIVYSMYFYGQTTKEILLINSMYFYGQTKKGRNISRLFCVFYEQTKKEKYL